MKKYMIYGIGEVVLVVVGILLALQIDNWNEDSKDREFEHYILTEIQKNLKEDSSQIETILEYRNRAQESINRMSVYLISMEYEDEQFKKDIARLFTFDRYYPIRTSYEMSKSKGSVITNEILRTRISRYYEYDQHRVLESVKDIENTFHVEFTPIFREGYFRNVTYGEYIDLIKPKDPKLVRLIVELLFVFKQNHKQSLEKINHFKSTNQELLENVNEELKKFR